MMSRLSFEPNMNDYKKLAKRALKARSPFKPMPLLFPSTPLPQTKKVSSLLSITIGRCGS